MKKIRFNPCVVIVVALALAPFTALPADDFGMGSKEQELRRLQEAAVKQQ